MTAIHWTWTQQTRGNKVGRRNVFRRDVSTFSNVIYCGSAFVQNYDDEMPSFEVFLATLTL